MTHSRSHTTHSHIHTCTHSRAAQVLGQMTGDRRRRGSQRLLVHEPFRYLLVAKEAHSDVSASVAGAGPARLLPLPDRMWGDRPHARLISSPRKRRRHVHVDVVLPTGEVACVTLTKRRLARADYRYARKCHEGDTLPLELLDRGTRAPHGSRLEPREAGAAPEHALSQQALLRDGGAALGGDRREMEEDEESPTAFRW